MKKIIGYEREKAQLAQLKDMLKNTAAYAEKGARIPRGLLLYGQPGVGKTMLARSIATGGIKLMEVRAADCCQEDAVETIQGAFAAAKDHQPSVLLLDELDKIAGGNEMFYMEGNDSVRKTLLQELDALSENDRVLVVATANDVESLGRALVREGRFDKRIHIEEPNNITRKRILMHLLGKVKIDKNVDVVELAHNTAGFTGAMLECLVNEAVLLALAKPTPVLDDADMRRVVNRIEFGSDEKDPFADKDYLHRVAVHEAGHATVAMLLTPDELYGASVMPQGNAAGHIRMVSDDGVGKTTEQMKNEVVVMLAGRAAEKEFLKGAQVGCASDYQGAKRVLDMLMTREGIYGEEFLLMNHAAGPVSLVSENLKAKYEDEMAFLLQDYTLRARTLLCQNRDLFQRIVSALEDHRVLSRDDLFGLMSRAA